MLTQLTPRQWSFLHRSFPSLLTGLPALPESQLSSTLHSPSPALSQHGRAVLLEAGDSYLRGKFPRLRVKSERLFGAEVNLRQLCRFLGMDGLIGDGDGLGSSDGKRDSKGLGNSKGDSNVLGNRTRNIHSNPLESQSHTQTTSSTTSLLALIGLMDRQLGRETVIGWLTDRYFSNSLFSPSSLLPTELLAYPIPHLTTHLRLRSSNPTASPEFRLHQESGRYSNGSVFVVGVYSPPGQLIGEGSGASIALAQRRAAVDALKRIYLQ